MYNDLKQIPMLTSLLYIITDIHQICGKLIFRDYEFICSDKYENVCILFDRNIMQ